MTKDNKNRIHIRIKILNKVFFLFLIVSIVLSSSAFASSGEKLERGDSVYKFDEWMRDFFKIERYEVDYEVADSKSIEEPGREYYDRSGDHKDYEEESIRKNYVQYSQYRGEETTIIREERKSLIFWSVPIILSIMILGLSIGIFYIVFYDKDRNNKKYFKTSLDQKNSNTDKIRKNSSQNRVR